MDGVDLALAVSRPLIRILEFASARGQRKCCALMSAFFTPTGSSYPRLLDEHVVSLELLYELVGIEALGVAAVRTLAVGGEVIPLAL